MKNHKLKLLSILLIFLFSLGCFGICSNVIKYNGKPVPKDNLEIYAHRGGRGLAPENTIPAYKSALEQGVDYVDMDINMTKDGVLVVAHDSNLNKNITRDANGSWIEKSIPINQLTLKQLKTYDVGKLKPNTDYANFFPYQQAMNNIEIPTLKEVIDYVKHIAGNKVGFQIEIKTDPTKPELTPTPKQYAKKLYEILKNENIIDRCEIQAFDWRCLIALNNLDANIKTAYLTDHTTDPLKGKDAGVWTAGHLPKNYDYSFPKMVKALGGYCWEPYEMDLTKKSLEEAHKLGLKVVVWGWPEQEKTEFNLKQIRKLINWGVDGIITDRPDVLRGIISTMGYNLPKGFKIN